MNENIYNQIDYMIRKWKLKSVNHARNKGELFAINKMPIESCPYGTGVYKDTFINYYEIELADLPF